MNANSPFQTALYSAAVGGITAASMLLAIPAGGISSLCLLAILITQRPVLALAVWGAVYVPVSGLWVFPAFEGPIEYILGGFGLSLSGFVFYGGSGLISRLVLRRAPVLILPASLLLAEVTAASLGLVMAPIGLFAVDSALSGPFCRWSRSTGQRRSLGWWPQSCLASPSARFPLCLVR